MKRGRIQCFHCKYKKVTLPWRLLDYDGQSDSRQLCHDCINLIADRNISKYEFNAQFDKGHAAPYRGAFIPRWWLKDEWIQYDLSQTWVKPYAPTCPPFSDDINTRKIDWGELWFSYERRCDKEVGCGKKKWAVGFPYYPEDGADLETLYLCRICLMDIVVESLELMSWPLSLSEGLFKSIAVGKNISQWETQSDGWMPWQARTVEPSPRYKAIIPRDDEAFYKNIAEKVV